MFNSKAYHRKYDQNTRVKARKRKRARSEYGKKWNREWMQNRRQQNKVWVDTLKLDHGCVDCGFNSHFAALDFDHIKGRKRFSISSIVHYTRHTLMKEIQKCVIRCANCHRIKTWKQIQE